jgi:hypothetical protein
MEEWRCGGMEVWRNGDVEEWRCGGMEVWRDGGVEEKEVPKINSTGRSKPRGV